MKQFLFFTIVSLISFSSWAQKFDEENLNSLSETYAKNSFENFKELLSIPNDAAYPENIEKNVNKLIFDFLSIKHLLENIGGGKFSPRPTIKYLVLKINNL